MSNSLDPDQIRRFVGPDLGPNCLPRLSADDNGRQRVNGFVFLDPNHLNISSNLVTGNTGSVTSKICVVIYYGFLNCKLHFSEDHAFFAKYYSDTPS